jgi:hypothetical protein
MPASNNAQGAFTVTVDYKDYERLTQAVATVRASGILLIYREYYRYFRPVLKARYDRASQETPYSKNWIGTKQEISGRTRGKDALYGIDSGNLYRDLTEQVKITNAGIEVFSDLPYAGSIMNLFASKGPYAPFGLWYVDDLDVDKLEEISTEYLQKALGLDVATAKP